LKDQVPDRMIASERGKRKAPARPGLAHHGLELSLCGVPEIRPWRRHLTRHSASALTSHDLFAALTFGEPDVWVIRNFAFRGLFVMEFFNRPRVVSAVQKTTRQKSVLLSAQRRRNPAGLVALPSCRRRTYRAVHCNGEPSCQSKVDFGDFSGSRQSPLWPGRESCCLPTAGRKGATPLDAHLDGRARGTL
jgi:hypothetical protein